MVDNKNEGIFLDLDGCWADTEPSHWASWRNAILPYGIKLTWENYANNAIGHSDSEILEQYLKHIDPSLIPMNPEIILEKKLEIYVEIAKTDCLVPQLNIDLIEKLKEYPLALITSSTRAEVDAVLYPTSLSKPFDVIVSFEDTTLHKPNPEPYLLAKKLLGVSVGLAFEDSASGLKSATDAGGLKVIKVPTPQELSRLVQENIA